MSMYSMRLGEWWCGWHWTPTGAEPTEMDGWMDSAYQSMPMLVRTRLVARRNHERPEGKGVGVIAIKS